MATPIPPIFPLGALKGKAGEPSREQMRALLASLTKIEARRKISTLFPPDGPLARHRYVKHMQFFKAGATHMERGFMAANRCVSPWTYVETPAQPRPSAEVWTSEDAHGFGWDGESRCAVQFSGGFLKGIEPAYRLVMASGQFVDCSMSHLLLTDAGWLSLDQIMSLSDGLRWWQTTVDYQANCAADGYLGDRELHEVGGIALERLPSPVGARRHSPLVFSLPDEAEHTLRHILSDPAGDRLSNSDDLRRLADLFSLFAGASSSTPDLSLSVRSQALARLARAFCPRPEDVILLHDQSSALRRAADLIASPGDPSTLQALDDLHLSLERSDAFQFRGSSVRELDQHADRKAIFFPSSHPRLVGGGQIVAIAPLGLQPIIDVQVPGCNTYFAGGVINHNCGKTIAGGVEMAFHATGEYPDWWQGRRFEHPVEAWAAGDTSETTRDIIQLELLGPKGEFGTGLIPGSALVGEPTAKRGISDAVDTISVRHKPSGQISRIGLKSYDQGRKKFQGTAKHVIWCDEEPPADVYTEMLIRLMTTDGIMMATFTPLLGLSEVALRFLPELVPQDDGGDEPHEETELERMVGASRPICIQAGWDDAPHLSEADKKKLYSAIPAYQREARTKGIPQLGAGAIYPFGEDEVVCEPFEIPVHFRRCYALDVGWNRTAALWLAHDQDTDVVYAYAEHYRGQAEPSVHASAINRRGDWIPGVIDPAARGRSQKDGERLIDIYGGPGLGLKLSIADNAVEAGILDVYDRFSTGRLKIFSTLRNTIGELRIYRRDEKGKIVKERDHLMDCLRYGVRSGLALAAYPPRDQWHRIRPGRTAHEHDYDASPWGRGR